MKLRDIFLEFLEHKKLFKSISPRTEEWYQNVYEQLYIPENLPLEHLKAHIVKKLQEAKDRGVKPVSLNCTIRWYNSFINWCMEMDYIQPSKNLRLKTLPQQQSIVKHISDDDIKKIKEARISKDDFPRYRTHTAVLLMLYTGMRLKEVRSLLLEDVDLQNRLIFIRNTKSHRDRFARIVDQIRPKLLSYLMVLKQKYPDTKYLFPDRSGKQWGDSGAQQAITHLGRYIGLPKKLSAHKLRHTFCIQLVEAGADISMVAKLAGHTSISTTQIYLQYSQEKLANIADKFIKF